MTPDNASTEALARRVAERFSCALVTGGAGFIGSHLCEHLLPTGIEVVSLDDYSAGKSENHAAFEHYDNFSAVECDITDVERLPGNIDGADLIFHNAASKKNICLHDPRRDLQVNAEGAYNLLRLAVDNGVRKFVHASTGSVYGEPQCFPQDEAHPLEPVSFYGISKLAGERYVTLFNREYGLDTTVLRYFHVYGPRQESNEFGGVVAIFIRNLMNNENPVIFGDGTQQRSFTHVNDIVRANLLVAVDERASGEVYNCASGISVTVQELCDATIECFGKSGEIAPRYEDWVPGDIKKFSVDSSKIDKLGFSFDRDFRSQLEELVNTETSKAATVR